MPVVQRAQRQTNIAALPGARRQASETLLSQGAGVERAKQEKAGAVAQLGNQVARLGADLYERIQKEEKESADTTALLKASNRLAEWKNARLYDPEKGAFAQKGENALGLPEQVKGEYDQLTGEIQKDLTADQQAMFAKEIANDWQQTDMQVRRHVFGEAQAFKQQELDSNIKNRVSAAQAAYLDPKMVGSELGKAIEAVRVAGPQLGMGKAQLETAERGIRSSVHTGVIYNLLGAEKGEAAKVYFDGVKDQIDGAVIDDVKKALEVGTDKHEAQKAFDKIQAEGGTWTEKRARARAIEDPDQRDLAEHYLDAEEARSERQERETHKATLRGAWDILDKTGGRLNAIPAATWRDMEPDERRSAQIYAEAKMAGIPIKTDQAVFYGLMQQAANDPAAFIKANIYTRRAQLSDSDLQQLAGLQVSIANQDRVAAGKLLDDYRTEKQVIDNALISARINPNPSQKDEPEKAAAIANLQRMVADRALALQANTGKKPTNKDIQQITDDILRQSVETPGSWWALYKNTGKKRLLESTIDDIPSADAAQVREFLKGQGLDPDDDDLVLQYWIDAQSRVRKK